jgi:hypothetical protein
MIQQKGRMAKIEKSVEGVKVTVSDLDAKLSGEIDVLAGQVVLKVDTNGNIGYIVLDGDPDTDLTSIKVKADNISLEGLVTVNSNFKVLADGSIEAVNAKFSGQITGSTININNVFSVDANGKVTSINGEYKVIIENGKIYTVYNNYVKTYFDGEKIEIGSAIDFGIVPNALMKGGYLLLSDGNTTGAKYVEFNPITGNFKYSDGNSDYQFVHTGNIGSQTVANATNADNANYANNAGYASSAGSVSGMSSSQITAVDTGYGNMDFSGLDNPAGVQWVDSNYQKIGASDVRLKYDISSLDDIPDELF